MDAPHKTFSEVVSIIKSLIPWRSKSQNANVSRDFWMPDKSCMVCYDCDSQFTLFNRRHHCRHCGKVFCAKCTENSVPASSSRQGNNVSVSGQRGWIRVCLYCYTQWEQGVATCENRIQEPNKDQSTTLSTSSLLSTKSSVTATSSNITHCPLPFSVGQQMQQASCLSLNQSSSVKGKDIDGEGFSELTRSNDLVADLEDPLPKQYEDSMNRSDNDGDECSVYQSDSETRQYRESMHYPESRQYLGVIGYYGQGEFDGINIGGSQFHPDGENINVDGLCNLSEHQCFDLQGLEEMSAIMKNEVEPYIFDENEAPSSLYVSEDIDAEPIDFENNGLLWLPPEPEDEEDEREATSYDDDDDDDNEDCDGNDTGEWGYLRAPSGSESGDQKMATKNVVDGHFRALVAQLLHVENLPVEENDDNSWLEIITSLSWEAATLLKPDTSQGGGMDPGGYVKVKCLACGNRSESVVIKGVVCKKNVAHRRMRSNVDKPRLLILGGALEYQRVTNHLSSVDTLLHQEMDHLKMAVAKIGRHAPDVLLVEKSVSRYAQEYLLTKGISLVLNVKRPLLERIARCTGTQIAPSIDHLSSQKVGQCDTFHVEKFVEDLNSAGNGGKKMMKTLMYFEGCPKPLGFTILLRGANKGELKKVKHVVKYGVFAAYHLALETSFLADEGASLPEFPLNAPITVTLPDKSSSIERSISTVTDFQIPGIEKSQGAEPGSGLQRAKSISVAELTSFISRKETYLSDHPYQSMQPDSSLIHYSSSFSSVNAISDLYKKLLPFNNKERNEMDSSEPPAPNFSVVKDNSLAVLDNNFPVNDCGTSYKLDQGNLADALQNSHSETSKNLPSASELSPLEVAQTHSRETGTMNGEPTPLKEEFPPSPSDNQSILVSLSSRCVWKGTVCERSHLFRIKYYGSFDKPLGRFLRDHLFDQNYQCSSCEMPSEAHVHCYTHRQGTLTISVKKLPEILLPGEKDGKIWMWHRCLKCPRMNGFPPATHRIIMSDAAWGLSFGKFLELSFSNHAAASRVAGCGHSLHRDCLRFYGFGNMVACLRYASIDVHSVFLPPHKLEFDHGIQEWIQKETDEVVDRAELLFSEVLKALSHIGDKRSNTIPDCSGVRTHESRHQVAQLEEMLRREKVEFQDALRKILNQEKRKGQPGVDILEINRLRRQLIFQSFMWDHRLVCADSSVNSSDQSCLSSSFSDKKERPSDEKLMSAVSMPGGFVDSIFMDSSLNKSHDLLNIKISPSDLLGQEIDTKLEKDDQFDHPEEPGLGIRRALSDGLFRAMPSLSDTLDAKWTGENQSSEFVIPIMDTTTFVTTLDAASVVDSTEDQSVPKVHDNNNNNNMEDSLSWLGMPFLNFYRSFNKNFLYGAQKFDKLVDYNPVYISSFREMELQGGARLLLPVGINEIVIPVFDDEPSSIIAYALMTPDYLVQLTDEVGEKTKDGVDSTMSSFLLTDSGNFKSFLSTDEPAFDPQKSFASTEDMLSSLAGSRSSWMLDPLVYTKTYHVRVSFGDDVTQGKVKYTVTCYYARRFEALRRVCCSELDYIRSLSRCKKWGAQGGKSNVFFAKTLDDRFIIKQVTKTELESFIKFGPEYFKYLLESIGTRSPTCLAKILGIYQVTIKHLKGGKESRMDVLVMENLLFRRNVTRLYDLKGSSRSRYNPDSSGSNKVLLDQNLIESMPTSPIFVGNKAKRLLERAVWNDTAFLASVGVMDYSLLAGVDEERHELVLGIIDFMRQYTWDKHLETWVKASGILGGPKNTSPTVISPIQYKKRFRKAMTTYFLMLPDQWSPPSIVTSKSLSDLCEDNNTHSTSLDMHL